MCASRTCHALYRMYCMCDYKRVCFAGHTRQEEDSQPRAKLLMACTGCPAMLFFMRRYSSGSAFSSVATAGNSMSHCTSRHPLLTVMHNRIKKQMYAKLSHEQRSLSAVKQCAAGAEAQRPRPDTCHLHELSREARSHFHEKKVKKSNERRENMISTNNRERRAVISNNHNTGGGEEYSLMSKKTSKKSASVAQKNQKETERTSCVL